jgi:hypothetical protein
MQTQWLQQSSDLIGNNVVMMMDFRKSDGKMAVATYGAGIFTANVLSVNPHTAAANFDVLDKLEVYPNPSNEKIWLDIENRQQYECNIYSYNGQLVTHCNQTPETINTSTLPNGIYFLELRNSKNVITKKLLINH